MIRCFAFAPTLRRNANMAWTALCGARCRGMRQDAASKRCMHAFKIFNSCLVMQVPSWLRDLCCVVMDLTELCQASSGQEHGVRLPCSQMELL